MKKIYIYVCLLILLISIPTIYYTKNKIVKVSSPVVAVTVEDPLEKVKKFYLNEVGGDIAYLSSFYNDSKNTNLDIIKLRIKTFSILKIEPIKILELEADGNKVIVASSFNVYFSGIQEPRPDLEVVGLVKKNNKWFIVNNFNDFPEADITWFRDKLQQYNNSVLNNPQFSELSSKQSEFDKYNKDFMYNASEKFNEEMSK